MFNGGGKQKIWLEDKISMVVPPIVSHCSSVPSKLPLKYIKNHQNCASFYIKRFKTLTVTEYESIT